MMCDIFIVPVPNYRVLLVDQRNLSLTIFKAIFVTNGGYQCGNSNINLVVFNSEYAIIRVEKLREGETKTHKTIVYY